MKRMTIGLTIFCLAVEFAWAQNPESNVNIGSGQTQSAGQESLQNVPTRELIVTGVDAATKEPVYTQNPVPPSTAYRAEWLPGGFLIALQSNPKLCAHVSTRPGRYVGELALCSRWNAARWTYNQNTDHLRPNLRSENRCLSSYPAGAGNQGASLLPCSDRDDLTHNKKWRLAQNGQIVSTNNALRCLSLEGMGKGAEAGTDLRIQNCASTNVRWTVINQK